MIFSVGVLPLVGAIALILLFLNPFLNPGPLFYRQERMGYRRTRFRIWKFRTMRSSTRGVRAHGARLEQDRITTFGRFLRVTRIDELPNVINVLRGEMSLVGPRPEAWSHAEHFLDNVPHYAERFAMRPGLTGLAQVRGEYADTPRTILRKARFDRYYVKNPSCRLDAYIMFVTVSIMFNGSGAK